MRSAALRASAIAEHHHAVLAHTSSSLVELRQQLRMMAAEARPPDADEDAQANVRPSVAGPF